MNTQFTHHPEIAKKLVLAGLRPTRQRISLGHLLFSRGCRHVTAESLHREAEQAEIHVSLATVYNTLHQFTSANLLREVSVEEGRSYFDTNTDSHHHFFCEENGELIDIPESELMLQHLPEPPKGMQVKSVDVVIRLKSAAC